MAEKEILSVEFDFPGGLAEYVSFSSMQSLSDADLVVFKPSMTGMRGYAAEMYRGRPSLSQDSSARLVESITHWRREISDALSAGTTVFVFLCEKDEVYVDSGQRRYSGTGRNRATTIVVTEVNNYQALPGDLSFITAKGSALRLAQNADILTAYWNEFEDCTQYVVHIQGQVTTPLLHTRDGRKLLGAVVRFKGSPGALVLLPSIELDWDEFYIEKDDDIQWTKKACKFGYRLRNALLEMDKTLHASSMRTPSPDWTRDARYKLSKESELLTRILQIEGKIEALEADKAKLKGDAAAESALRQLLYEKGKPLETQIRRSLEILGFTVSSYRDSESEFDVVFESAEGRLLGEAEGKDNRAVNIDKLRQLEMNIHEDFSRECVQTMAKGVLFGNAHRLKPLEQRPDWFTQKCITAATRSGSALVRTSDLFFIARYLLEENDASFAAQCREAFFAAGGTMVVFPEVPQENTRKRRENVRGIRKTREG